MRQDWKKLVLVQAGGVICLPVFIIGHALAKTYGIYSAILAIYLGNFLLLLMGAVTARASFENRKSTAECAIDVFGSKGYQLFSFAMVFSMIGWFAIQMNIMTSSLNGFLDEPFMLYLNLLFGMIITLVAIKGMKSLTFIASCSMPFLILTIGYALVASSGNPTIVTASEDLSFGGISLVIACGIAAVIDLPTFFRLAKTKKDSVIAACLLFGLVLPLIESVGLYLFLQNSSENITQVLLQENSPFYWKIWVICFLILAGWTTNNANLYSATVSLETLIPKLSDKTRTIILGILGTLLSCLDLLNHLNLSLEIIGIVLGSMGAIIVFHFAFKETKIKENIYVWMVGATAGFMSYFGFALFKIPVLDAFTIAFLTKLLIKVIRNEKIISVRS